MSGEIRRLGFLFFQVINALGSIGYLIEYLPKLLKLNMEEQLLMILGTIFIIYILSGILLYLNTRKRSFMPLILYSIYPLILAILFTLFHKMHLLNIKFFLH